MGNTGVYFFVPPGVHLLDMTGPAHVFYELTEIVQNVRLHYLSTNNSTEGINSSAGLFLGQLQDFTAYQLSKDDIIFIPGLDPEILFTPSFLQQCRPFFAWLQQQQKNGATICSVCTGAFLLAAGGLLNGRKCTTHWRYFDRFKTLYPSVELVDDCLFVRDGQIMTSAGVASGIDLALQLISEHFGPERAAAVAKETVIYLRRGGKDPQLSAFLQFRNHLDGNIHLAQDYLSQHLSEDCSISRIAQQVNMSPRNFSRRFRKMTGITPGKYLESLRVEKAISLLKRAEKVSTVARSVGLKSQNQLRALLLRNTGKLPSGFR
jgi:transcriptional regulator GlxA family with amidase domain